MNRKFTELATATGAIVWRPTTTHAESIRLSLTVSPELNERLEQLAAANHSSKSEILRKAVALSDVVAEAKSKKYCLGILDQDKRLVTEIVGI